VADFTKGPWTIYSEPDHAIKIEHGPRSICKLPYYVDAENTANASLIAASPDMFVALAKLLCPACDHELQHHLEKEGCEIERGDGYRAGSEILEALGPCGCNVDDLRDDYPDFVRAIEAFRKAKGESRG
jgi:hypothetical protein